MQKLIYLPQLELNMDDIQVQRWLAEEGALIREGENLVEVETQKASTEVTAPHTGYLRKKLVAEGARITGADAICIFTDTTDESFTTEDDAVSPPAQSKAISPSESMARASVEILASPAVRRIAKERGINLSSIQGSGEGGRILEKDLNGQAEVPVDFVKFSSARMSLNRQMQYSIREIPQIQVSRELDVTSLLIKEEGITVTHRLLAALGRVLLQHQIFCAAVKEDGYRLLPPSIAIAMDGGEGKLFAPVLRSPECLSLPEIGREVRRLLELVKAGKLSTADLKDGPFAVSNLGMLGVDAFNALVFEGQVAVLAVGRVRQTANGSAMANFTLAVDHRIIDGAEAARFLQTLGETLAEPNSL